MTGNYLIGLREGLEAALLLVLLLAYLRRTGRTALIPRLWAGVAVAVLLSAGFGALLTFGPQGLTFEAQEAIGGGLSILAVALVTGMVFWMARTARTLGTTLTSRMDAATTAGGWAVAVVAAVTVGREGLETALFLWAAAQASGQTWQPLAGSLAGIATAVLIGWLIGRGTIRLNLATFFRWTGALLIVIAGGVLAYGIHDLQEARILPGLNALAFDLSAAVPPASWYGTLLKGVFNFSPASTWLEVAAWLLYVVPTLAIYLRVVRRPVAARTSPSAPAARTSLAVTKEA
ncbi:iron transporter [Tersicoccus solisilvae]|uniref:Iron transporter n=1 Tax=Tersicoccus solisilvae TaxID=1882339 RepID=A0ABQ1NKA0_9MICC|nr:iron uptake transporter permease EfeU [Tersicoccus solisilvae]GGC78905.1 iron transporter [Tersicoccus solisilvae]